MSRIRVTPEQLQALGSQLQQAANDLAGIASRMNQVIGSLDWEVRRRSSIESDWSAGRGQLQSLTNTLQDHGQRLVAKAQAYIEADADSASTITPPPPPAAPLPVPTPPPQPWPLVSVPLVTLPALPLLSRLLEPPQISIQLPSITAPDWLTNTIGKFLGPLNPAATTPPGTPGVAPLSPGPTVGPGGRALSQLAPFGDENILGLRRVVNANGDIEYMGSHSLGTVRDHIRAYGCLMTSYTMLLRDKGAQVTVTDLYRANYELSTGHNFAQDAANGTIVMPNLYAQAGMVHRAAADFTSQFGSLGAGSDDLLRQALANSIREHGSVTVHVNSPFADGHWIVVDGLNPDGSFVIRDPLKGSVTNALLGGGSPYQFNPDHRFGFVIQADTTQA